MAAPAGNLQAASTQRRQVQVAKTGSQKASSKAISAVMMNAYKKYLRKNVRSKKILCYCKYWGIIMHQTFNRYARSRKR